MAHILQLIRPTLFRDALICPSIVAEADKSWSAVTTSNACVAVNNATNNMRVGAHLRRARIWRGGGRQGVVGGHRLQAEQRLVIVSDFADGRRDDTHRVRR